MEEETWDMIVVSFSVAVLTGITTLATMLVTQWARKT